MKQIKIKNDFTPPMPVVLAGAVVNGKENFMAVGWCMRVNMAPNMIAISLDKKRYTLQGILENDCFSICLPGCELEKQTDFCGIFSGTKADKSKLFTSFYGKLKKAPMIEECAVNLICKLHQTVDLGNDMLVIGEVVEAFAREDVLDNGKTNIKKITPMIFTMPENTYWQLGKPTGTAWKDGFELNK